MKNSALVLLLTTFSLTMTEAANAAFFEQQDVFCQGEKCGTMQINTYKPHEDEVSGGVDIAGLFDSLEPFDSWDFHYIQAVDVYNDFPLLLTDGTALPTSYFVDTPPGGYQGQTFDLFPYYDEKGEFPTFSDAPRTRLTDSSDREKTGADGKLDVKFETWLVSELDDTVIKDEKAENDFFTVSPLLGWTWGFSIKDADDGVLNPNFTTIANPFNWLTGTPSANWNTALGQIYGRTDQTQDRFNVAVVPNTPPTATTPEPTSILMFLGMGAVGAASLLKRKQNQDA
jgi:PEP-CTERM motif